MTALHCWHCGRSIGRTDTVCPTCQTRLTDRASAAVRYRVVGGRRTDGDEVPRPRSMAAIAVGPRDGGIFTQHWRGQLPLDVSFWGVMLLGSLALIILPFILTSSLVLLIQPIDPGQMIIMAMSITLTAAALVGFWQAVGTWRSARRWMKVAPRPRWGHAAQIVTMIFVLFCVALLVLVVLMVQSVARPGFF